ncbi:MAG TPA: metallothionein [Acidimicrobiales bacterium]|nr:metallothionein [Acidimicrobiales bacterium]
MSRYQAGTIMTCTHEECHCRVVIVDECDCPGVAEDKTYMCACGTPLVRLSETTSSARDTQ